MTVPPDWITSTPSTPAIHNKPPPAGGALVPPFTPEQLLQIGAQFIEQFLGKVVQAVIGVFIPGDNGAAFAQLQGWASGIEGLLLAVPTEIATIVQQVIQQVIDAIVSASGIASVGNDIASIPVAILAAAEQAGVQFLQGFAALLGLSSTQTAQITALQNNAGTAMSDNFATTTVAGYHNLVGTLAVSNRGPYLQTPNIAVAYRNTGFASDKHGLHIVIDGNMQGALRAGICCDTTASNYAAIEVYSGFSGDALRLVTGSSPVLAVVQRQFDLAGNNRLVGGTTFDVKYDTLTNTFLVFVNGQPAFTWPDLGTSPADAANLVSHGGSKRQPLVVTNAFDRNEDGFYGPGLSHDVCYDWAA